MLSDVGGGVSECSGRPVFIFFIKENWICAMTRHHAEPNINILLARSLPFDSYVRQWSHPLMIPLHCLWDKSNNRTRGQFELVLLTWFYFCFDFVRSHARCGCCSIVTNCKFWGKNPRVHLIIIREWPKNPPSPILRNLVIFTPGAFYSTPLHLSTRQ